MSMTGKLLIWPVFIQVEVKMVLVRYREIEKVSYYLPYRKEYLLFTLEKVVCNACMLTTTSPLPSLLSLSLHSSSVSK